MNIKNTKEALHAGNASFTEWKEKYKEIFSSKTNFTGTLLDDSVDANMELWLEEGEWEITSPKTAVEEDLSYWD